MNSLTRLLSSRVKAELFRLLFGADAREVQQSWPEITRLAREGGKTLSEQSGLFGST